MKALLINNEEGFSLVEILVAVVIMGVGISALATMIVSAMNISSHSQLKLQAIMLAQNAMEMTFRNLGDIVSDQTLPIKQRGDFNWRDDKRFTEFIWERKIDKVKDDLYQISITIKRNDGKEFYNLVSRYSLGR